MIERVANLHGDEVWSSEADAEFIAHCPDDLRWLLDRVTRLETALERIADGTWARLEGDWMEEAEFARAALDTEQP